MPNKNAAAESTEAMPEPIDYIDLTQDSPANRGTVLRIRNRNCENETNLRSRTSKLRKQNSPSQRTVQHDDSVIIEIPDSNANHDANVSKNLATAEIIDLDATTSPKYSGTCFMNDSVKGNLVVLTCPICFEELTPKMKPTSTQCGHIFCENCLVLAMRSKKKCPTCQAAVKLKSCTRLYF